MNIATPKDSYNDPQSAQNHLDWLDSPDGQFFREFQYQAFVERLGNNLNQKILDAACGSGWLTGRLSEKYPNIEGVDFSDPFLKVARSDFPQLKFNKVDLNEPLPYQADEFDTIVMSMAAHDIENQQKTFKEFYRILKPSGRLMLTIVNPYYGKPGSIWKRSVLDLILNRKPKLYPQEYNLFAKNNKTYTYNKTVKSYFVKLSDHLNNLRKARFNFEFINELSSSEDSPHFDTKYRLHRYPTILYLEFSK